MPVKKTYDVDVDGLSVNVKIASERDFTLLYEVSLPEISAATAALLDSVKEDLLVATKISAEEIFDPQTVKKLKDEFRKKAGMIIEKKMPRLAYKVKSVLVTSLVNEMLGLGELEIFLADTNLEEIVVNSSKEPVWVYHKEFGWLKTNVCVKSEKQIQNYASIIARRIGRQINILDPLLDAHLVTGDRANATLFPISTKGNTLTIRKFARKPWTITDFVENKTLNSEVAAFLWLIIQYELNMIIAGGTSSGKTSFLNTLMPFIQPNHRIISIEDTRELQLPDYLHWVPLTTREPNPEGKGGIEMLDLMINSLRMRPDRIIVGEIRRADQAEVLFEAMHTGHSVYATLHADTVEQVIRRMTNPPINIPDVMLEALHAIGVMYRDRRKGIRKMYQLAELMPTGETGEKIVLKPSVLYRYKPNGEIVAHDECVRIFDALKMHTGMTQKEIIADLTEKIKILNWLVENHVNGINDIGRIIATYYANSESVFNAAAQKLKPGVLLK